MRVTPEQRENLKQIEKPLGFSQVIRGVDSEGCTVDFAIFMNAMAGSEVNVEHDFLVFLRDLNGRDTPFIVENNPVGFSARNSRSDVFVQVKPILIAMGYTDLRSLRPS